MEQNHEPDYERVADVLVRVVLRLLGKDEGPRGGGLRVDYRLGGVPSPV